MASRIGMTTMPPGDGWLPHALHPATQRLDFVRVAPDEIERASFLDGRTPIGDERRGISLAALPVQRPAPLRVVLHVSFCGSTLLSRLLDVPGRTIVLREPAILVDLADWYAAVAAIAKGTALRDPGPTVAAVTGALDDYAPATPVIVKPSNWSNVLLQAWDATTIDPVFLSIRPDAFLRAVFRGGRDRIAFTMRAAQHFARIVPGGDAAIANAATGTPDALDQAARLTLVALELQSSLFRTAMARNGWGPERWIDFATLRADPMTTTLTVARLLACPLDREEVAERLVRAGGNDAKAPRRSFDPDGEAAANRAIDAHHGRRFAAALSWAGEQDFFADEWWQGGAS